MHKHYVRPKKDNLTALDDYRRAETIGEEHGDCWSFYPACPFSIFNIIPDIYTKDDQVKNMVIKYIILPQFRTTLINRKKRFTEKKVPSEPKQD